MPWAFYNDSGELQINDGGVTNPVGANVDLSSYKLVGGGGSTGIAISANGEVSMAAQPCFLSRNNAAISNVSGDGTDYTMVFATEIFDQNADYDGASTFTAPITGRYILAVTINVEGMATNHTTFRLVLVTSNRQYQLNRFDGGDHADFAPSANPMAVNGCMIVDMDASDTATVFIDVDGGSATVDINGSSGGETTFGGYLLA